MNSSPDTNELILASCFADDKTSGGLFVFDGTRVDVLDRLSCTGMSVIGSRLVRLLGAPDEPGSAGEMVIYDPSGVERYFRLDSLIDAHDVVWHNDGFVVASAATNTILWITMAGEIVRTWKAPGDGDCWHLNSLLVQDGRLFVSAFGRYATHRAWTQHLSDSAGFVMEVDTGRDVVTQLRCPHSLRMLDGLWTLCNSASHQLIQVDPDTGETVRAVTLRGWTRGLAVGRDVFYVGESADRKARDSDPFASIAAVDRTTWDVVGRWMLDAPEVYDLVVAPEPLVAGARRGFRTNQFRVMEQVAWQRERADVDSESRRVESAPLPEADSRVRIEAEVPPILSAGERISIPCRVTNLGARPLVSAPPNPVHFSHQWTSNGYVADGENGADGERHRLPGIVPAGQTASFQVGITVPAESGEFLLRLTLVQEMVRWFDEVDPLNVSTFLVWVA